jgi:hypothetical protein
MDNLKKALGSFLGDVVSLSDAASSLSLFSNTNRVAYEQISAVVIGNVDDVLLTFWEWKLTVPMLSSRCSEWDYRILQAEPGEYYEMPNISKALVQKGMATGRWQSPAAIRELFKEMGEPEWEKMPELVLTIKQDSRHNIISGAQIGKACRHCGLGDKTGAMIAILKSAGIISPKLAAINAYTKSKSPLYEFNPCVYAEKSTPSLMKFDVDKIEDSRFYKALSQIFLKKDALLLARILDGNLNDDTIRIGANDIAQHDMKEMLLLAFDERILIPIDSRGGPAWEDKILEFNQDALFFMLPVVKAILHTIYESGQPYSEKAVSTAISETNSEDRDEFIRMLQIIMKHATDHQFEVGLLEILSKSISANLDLHDFLDLAVACGMMSPCPRKSLLTGLSWYEINPVLYWDKDFLV